MLSTILEISFWAVGWKEKDSAVKLSRIFLVSFIYFVAWIWASVSILFINIACILFKYFNVLIFFKYLVSKYYLV